jgi:hypothetical protein
LSIKLYTLSVVAFSTLPSQVLSRDNEEHDSEVGRDPEAGDEKDDSSGRLGVLVADDDGLVGRVGAVKLILGRDSPIFKNDS